MRSRISFRSESILHWRNNRGWRLSAITLLRGRIDFDVNRCQTTGNYRQFVKLRVYAYIHASIYMYVCIFIFPLSLVMRLIGGWPRLSVNIQGSDALLCDESRMTHGNLLNSILAPHQVFHLVLLQCMRIAESLACVTQSARGNEVYDG